MVARLGIAVNTCEIVRNFLFLGVWKAALLWVFANKLPRNGVNTNQKLRRISGVIPQFGRAGAGN